MKAPGSACCVRCVRCGGALREAATVCEGCDLELSRASLVPRVGRHVCPHRAMPFNTPWRVCWPLDGPWFRPRPVQLRCPHCLGWLRDQMDPRISTREFFIILTVAVSAQLWLPMPVKGWVLLGVLAAWGYLIGSRRKRKTNPAERYVSGPCR
jgi:hypothetical protein